MNPNGNYQFPVSSEYPGGDSDASFKKKLRLLAVLLVIVVIVIVVLALSIHKKPAAPAFNVTRTIPAVTSVTTQTASMLVYFNEPLTPNSAQVTSYPSIITKSTISGDILSLTFASNTLLSSKTYLITIKSISSTSQHHLTNKELTFKPSYTAPTFTGESGLTNVGITTAQVNGINSAVSELSPWAKNASIDTSTIKHFMEDPSNPWSPWAVSFTMNVDGTNYNFVGDFYDAQDIQVKVYNPTSNQLILTSGSPGSV